MLDPAAIIFWITYHFKFTVRDCCFILFEHSQLLVRLKFKTTRLLLPEFLFIFDTRYPIIEHSLPKGYTPRDIPKKVASFDAAALHEAPSQEVFDVTLGSLEVWLGNFAHELRAGLDAARQPM